MRARRRQLLSLTAVASFLALALLGAAPSARAHDEDEWYDDDDDSYYDDDYDSYDQGYDDPWSHDGWCTYDNCPHHVSVPHYDTLSPYGSWRFVPAFGTHLWFPWVDRSWRPYYYGHWVRTSFGMTWVSHEPWGDIPHHYGHWVYTEPYGWGWIPGWQWSPAVVTWSVADGYVGWAPCPPSGYRYPHYRHYRSGVRVSWYGYRPVYDYPDCGLDFSFWIFVGNRDFYGRPVYRHAISRPSMLSLWKTKRVQPVGPRLDVASVQKVTPERMRTVRLDKTRTTIGGRSLELYEPRGQKEFIRTGSDAAKRTYVRPDRTGGKTRVERSPAVRESAKGRREAPSRVENSKPRRDEPSRVESSKPRKDEPSRGDTGKRRSDAPQRVESGKRGNDSPSRAPQKVERNESRGSARDKVADKPSGGRSESRSNGKADGKADSKSKSRSDTPQDRGGKRSGR